MSGTVASKARTVVPDKADQQVTGNKQDKGADKPVKARKSKPAGTKTGTSGRTKSTASKKAVTKKVATGKTTRKKTTRKKTSPKKTSPNKAAGKKAAARKKPIPRTPASSGQEAQTTRRAEPSPSDIPVHEATGSVAAADVNAPASPDDPKSMSWMAAQAIKALNAVKEHQAEKAQAERLVAKRKTGASRVEATPDAGTERAAAPASQGSRQEVTSGKARASRETAPPVKAGATAAVPASRSTKKSAAATQPVIPAPLEESAGSAQSTLITPPAALPEPVAAPETVVAKGNKPTVQPDTDTAAPATGAEAVPAASPVPDVTTGPSAAAPHASAAEAPAASAESPLTAGEADPGKLQSIPEQVTAEPAMETSEVPAVSADTPDTAGEPGAEAPQGTSMGTKPAMAKDKATVVSVPQPETSEAAAEVPEGVGDVADAVVVPAARSTSRRGFPLRPAMLAGCVLLAAWLGYHSWFAGHEDSETYSVSDQPRDDLVEPGQVTEPPPPAISAVPAQPAAVAVDMSVDQTSGGGEGSQASAAAAGMPQDPATAVQITATPSLQASTVTGSPSEQAPPGAAVKQPETPPAETTPPSGEAELAGVADPAGATPGMTPPAQTSQPARSAPRAPRYPAPGYGYYPQQQRWQQPYYRPYQQAAPR